MLTTDKAVQMSPLQLHCINKRMTLPLASSGEEPEGQIGVWPDRGIVGWYPSHYAVNDHTCKCNALIRKKVEQLWYEVNLWRTCKVLTTSDKGFAGAQ